MAISVVIGLQGWSLWNPSVCLEHLLLLGPVLAPPGVCFPGPAPQASQALPLSGRLLKGGPWDLHLGTES